MRQRHIYALAVFTALVVAAALSIGGQSSRATSPIPEEAVSVEDAARPFLGSADAPVVMVVFTDYQCPFCKKFFETRLPALREDFTEAGQLRIVVRDMPLARHRFAEPAAGAAACADRQGAYWQMHEALYARQLVLPETDLGELARSLSIDGALFDACMEDDIVRQRLREDMDAAMGAKIGGTPAFLIGIPMDGRIVGRVIVGYQPLTVYETDIREYLAGTASP